MTDSETTSVTGPILYLSVMVLLAALAGFFVLQLVGTAALAPGEFTAVELEPGNETVHEQRTVDVSATIQNTGDRTATQHVEISVGDTVHRETLTLGPDEAATVQLRGIEADTLGIGNTTYSVATDDDERSATLVVESNRPPVFEVTELEPSYLTVASDERAAVTAVIENVGGATGNQTVELRFDGVTYIEEPMDIEPGASETLDAFVDLGWLPVGQHPYGVHTANDSASGTVSIFETGSLEFEAVDVEPESPIYVGERFSVSMTVANTGNVSTEETVEFRIDDSVLRTRGVELVDDAETTVVFEDIDSDRIGIGNHSYLLTVGDSAETGTVVVEGDEPARFEVGDLQPGDTELAEGEPLNVSATIENTGEQTANETVELRLDGESRQTISVELPPGASTDIERSIEDIESGEYEYGLVTDSDEVTATLVVDG